MKREIYISKLAFSNHNFNLLKKIVKNYDLQGIDFAPINLWNNWTNLKKKIFVLKNFLEKNKIKINAVQGIFYKKDFNLFDDKKMTKKKISKHIMIIINMCEKIKCKKIIIGSSNFRKKEDLDLKKADDIFIKFFSKYKNILKKKKIFFCIECIQSKYGEDYLHDFDHLVRLIKKINSSQIRINFDTSIYHFSKFNFNYFRKNQKLIKNIQVTEPNFQMFTKLSKKNIDFAKKLKRYKKFNKISLEIISKRMNSLRLMRSISVFKKYYIN